MNAHRYMPEGHAAERCLGLAAKPRLAEPNARGHIIIDGAR